MQRWKKAGSIVGSIFSLLILILGLFDVPEQLAKLANLFSVLATSSNTVWVGLTSDVGRWLLTIAGVACLLLVNGSAWLRASVAKFLGGQKPAVLPIPPQARAPAFTLPPPPPTVSKLSVDIRSLDLKEDPGTTLITLDRPETLAVLEIVVTNDDLTETTVESATLSVERRFQCFAADLESIRHDDDFELRKPIKRGVPGRGKLYFRITGKTPIQTVCGKYVLTLTDGMGRSCNASISHSGCQYAGRVDNS